MKVKNKVFVVTGGGNGMGREMVLNLLKKEAKVAAVDINEQALLETKKLAGKLQDRLSIHVLDITKKEMVEAFPDEVIKIHGTVDGIINNAGIIQPFVRISEIDYLMIERVFNINFYGVLYMTKAFLPYLLTCSEAHIINISSMGGFLPIPGQSIYGASKAATKIFTEGLWAELRNTNINVTLVLPGAINTNIKINSGAEKAKNEPEKTDLKILTPSKAAQIIINGIEKNKLMIFVGSMSKLMNLMYRLSPKFATTLISSQMKNHIPD